MPLRAKLPVLTASQTVKMTTQSLESIAPLKEDDPEDVLFQSIYGLRTIELNRPPKLNSLNASMIRKIAPRLREWSRSDMANVVVMKGAGAAFCAGGDVGVLAKNNKEGPEGQIRSCEYFATEYKLDHLIATYNKPYIAFMDGVTMGGGVGLSIHAPFRIATENTLFAMPETNIGFFPDVGGTFFLNRMNGAMGTYLALTSARLKAANVYYAGLATHYLPSAQLPALEQRLAELRFNDYDDHATRLSLINQTIEEFQIGLPWNESLAPSGAVRKAIDHCFSEDTANRIYLALKKYEDGSNEEVSKWASETIDSLIQRSPTAVHISLANLRTGKLRSIADTFQQEYSLATKFMAHADFTEGVSALLLHKPKRDPKWESLEDFKIHDERQVQSVWFQEANAKWEKAMEEKKAVDEVVNLGEEAFKENIAPDLLTKLEAKKVERGVPGQESLRSEIPEQSADYETTREALDRAEELKELELLEQQEFEKQLDEEWKQLLEEKEKLDKAAAKADHEKWRLSCGGDLMIEDPSPLVKDWVQSGGKALALWTDGDYIDYPYNFGLPTEVDVGRFIVSQGEVIPKKVVEHFEKKYPLKQGVREVVEDIVGRNTKSSGSGRVVWNGPDIPPQREIGWR